VIQELKNNNINDLISWGRQSLLKYNIDNAQNEIEWFLCFLLNCNRAYLHLHYDKLIHNDIQNKFQNMVKRRINGEPFQYIIGYATFYGRDFYVNSNVFIPRPETELIIDRLKSIKKIESLLDICTGTGCIAITSYLENITTNIMAIDISPATIKLAKLNMKKFGVKNINFQIHNFITTPFNIKFDVIVCNPPYIPKKDLKNLQNEVIHFEPSLALSDNKDGLSFYKKLSESFSKLVNPNGRMILEFGGNKQQPYIDNIFKTKNLSTKYYKDLQNEYRIVEITQ